MQLYTTAEYPCSYLPTQQARSLVVAPNHLITTPVYSSLMEQGFRRSGNFTYRPHCAQCQACESLRVVVAHFQPSRSQRRAWQRHGHLEASIQRLHYNPAHYALYQRYEKTRHPAAAWTTTALRNTVSFCWIAILKPAWSSFATPAPRMLW